MKPSETQTKRKWLNNICKINGWNLQITHLERKIIFQTSMIMFHVNLQGCRWFGNLVVSKIVRIGSLCRCLSLTISFRHPKLPYGPTSFFFHFWIFLIRLLHTKFLDKWCSGHKVGRGYHPEDYWPKRRHPGRLIVIVCYIHLNPLKEDHVLW